MKNAKKDQGFNEFIALDFSFQHIARCYDALTNTSLWNFYLRLKGIHISEAGIFSMTPILCHFGYCFSELELC